MNLVKWINLGKASIFAAVAATLFPVGGVAGVRDSGGGNAVVCFESETQAQRVQKAGFISNDLIGRIQSIEAYDLYEARQINGRSVDSFIRPTNPGQFKSYAGQISERFRKYVPLVSEIIEDSEERFGEVLWSGALTKQDDINSILAVEDSRCAVATMAVQEDVGAQSKLYIDRRLFDHAKHTALSRGVLYLHELLYLKARDNGQTDSKNTRILLAQLISRNAVTVETTDEMLSELGFIEFSTDLPVQLTLQAAYRDLLMEAVRSYQVEVWPKTELIGKVTSFLDQMSTLSVDDSQRLYYRSKGCGLLVDDMTSPELIPAQISSCRYVLEALYSKLAGLRQNLNETEENNRQDLIRELKHYESKVSPLIEASVHTYYQSKLLPRLTKLDYPEAFRSEMIAATAKFLSEIATWPTDFAMIDSFTGHRRFTVFARTPIDQDVINDVLKQLDYNGVLRMNIP